MYTHYWYRDTSKEAAPMQWVQICAAFSEIYRSCRLDGIKLVREYDEPNSKPEVTHAYIRFNGMGEEGHETMLLDRIPQGHVRDGEVFAFCKTSRKSYTIAVEALLLAAEFYAPGVWRIESDGDREDWQEGIILFEKVTGQNAPKLECLE